jgi:hypothetical protein
MTSEPMTDTAELKPAAWQSAISGIVTTDPDAANHAQFEPLYSASAIASLTEQVEARTVDSDTYKQAMKKYFVQLVKAEATVSRLTAENEKMHGAEELLTAQNIIVRAVWDALGGEDPTRADGQNIVARVREVVAENEKMREALKLSIKIIGAVGKYIRAEDKLVRDKKREPMTSRDAADMASIRLLDFDARDCDEIIRRARASMSNTSEGGKGE